MKLFKETITIIVPVDAIAHKLLATMDESNPHRELITETIIDAMFHDNRLGMLYNSLNGISVQLDLEIGQTVISHATYSGYIERDTAESKLYDADYKIIIGEATIIELDIYKDANVKLSWMGIGSQGQPKAYTAWVNNTTLTVPKTTFTSAPETAVKFHHE